MIYYQSITVCWCGRGDSNPHALRRHPLKMVRLPVPPLPPGVKVKLLRCAAKLSRLMQSELLTYFDGAAGAAGAGAAGAGADAGAAGAGAAGADFAGVFENCCSTEEPKDAVVVF